MSYNPNYDAPKAWADFNESTSQGDKFKIIEGLTLGFYASGAYSADWSGVTLPSTTNNGKWCLRYNTDTSTLRLYVYTNTAWKYIEFT